MCLCVGVDKASLLALPPSHPIKLSLDCFDSIIRRTAKNAGQANDEIS